MMKRTLLAAVSASVLSLGIVSTTGLPAVAQGVQQLQDSVSNSLAQLGMDTSNVDMLTLRQLSEIELVVNGTSQADVKMGQIEEIMGDPSMGGGMGMASEPAEMDMSTMSGMMGEGGLEQLVSKELAQLDIEGDIDVKTLTVGQLSEIMLVTNTGGDRELQREQIQTILGIQ